MLKMAVAGIIGIPGRFPSDRVAGINRNGWSFSFGMGGHFRRNTQL